MDDESGDQDAVQARRKTDGEVEFADRHREREAGGDDHRKRGLVEDIGEVVDRREGARREEREGNDHRDEADDRSVTREDTEGRLRTWA